MLRLEADEAAAGEAERGLGGLLRVGAAPQPHERAHRAALRAPGPRRRGGGEDRRDAHQGANDVGHR
jgi:hypothetical protein